MKTLQYDFELDNAIFFHHYVLVLVDGEMAGGGLVGGYDKIDVVVGDRKYSRKVSTFVQAPPPQIQIDFV
ncbi:MAG: hypothetical protein K6T85_17370 [Gorillibacterium sp.]|nr:hypothetical protein [Gorillibacterium sp.]